MRITAIAIVAGLALAGCKKKDEKPAGGGGTGTEAAAAPTSGTGTANAAGGATAGLKVETACPKSLGGEDRGLQRTITKACGDVAVTEDYRIDGGELVLEAGARLVMKPGVRITVGYYEPARLTVKGTAADPVVFTTSGDKAAGVWGGVVLTRGAARSAIAGAVIEYAGTDDQGALDLEADDVTVTDTVIRDAKGIGVRVGDETVVKELAGVTFERAGAIAASLPAASVGALGACTFGDGHVQIRGGTVERDATWRNPGTYFVVDQTVRVDGKNARATVTIEAGAEVRMGRDTRIDVGYYSPGALKIAGTPEKPVRFTAKEAGEPGAWRGLQASEKGEIVVANAVLEHGGTADDGGVLSAASGGSLAVTGAVLRGNVVGVRVVEGGKLKSLDATTFEGNTTAMQIHVDALGAVGGGNTYAAPQVIELIPGTVAHDATWSAQPGAEIRTENNIAVDKATLTLAAGLELRFDGDARLSVGYYQKGNVRAEGTAEKPVVLRGVRDEAEAWHGVVLHEHADASTFTHTLVADTKNVAAIELSSRARVELRDVIVRRSKAGVKWGCDGKANPDGLKIEGGGKAALSPGGC